jgi:WD40 repeat protein
VWEVSAHDSRVLGSALSPDGSTVGTCASDENLKVRPSFSLSLSLSLSLSSLLLFLLESAVRPSLIVDLWLAC